ncbi:MAG TPA: hypothetical protein VM429_06420, partial [Micropruina sp.]|nr:hypothetical protein [Micropruina sp.]
RRVAGSGCPCRAPSVVTAPLRTDVQEVFAIPTTKVDQAIVTGHEGQYGVTSVPGRGSTFWLELPKS